MIERKKRNMVVSFSNYKDIIVHLHTVEPPYNPANKSLSLEELESMSKQVEAIIASLSAISAEAKSQSKRRYHLFSSIDTKVRRVLNELHALGISIDEINSIKSVKMRIEGRRIGELPDEAFRGSLAGRGYRKKLGYLRDIISLLRTIENYKPNSSDLTLLSLNEFYGDLVSVHRLNTELHLEILSLMNKRNQLYNNEYGLYDLMHKVKQYFLSTEGRSGFNYKVLCKFPVYKIREYRNSSIPLKRQQELKTPSTVSQNVLEEESPTIVSESMPTTAPEPTTAN